MKRVLVLSDSHGNVGNMIRAVKREEPDMILHLGDCVVDADALRREFPHITMVNVPGNCDFSRGDTERLIDIDGYTGGYNLQAAWSSGYVAGSSLLEG